MKAVDLRVGFSYYIKMLGKIYGPFPYDGVIECRHSFHKGFVTMTSEEVEEAIKPIKCLPCMLK